MDAGGTSSSYDVFLSFRGKDTRNNFTSHLYSALKRNQIKAYLDEKTLERGDDLSLALPEEIEKSKISIIIFSENYASSSWCLRELVHIFECRRQNKHVMIPIFYKVDPSDIKDQKGSYGKAFAKHEESLKDKMDIVQKWKDALTASAYLSGWVWNSQDTRSEAELIKAIVKDVSRKLGRMRYSSYVYCKGLIGIERHISNIDQWLLRIGSPDVRIVGIWGSGGVGKTALASAIFAEHYYKFESCYFLENVREESERQGLSNLRNKLLNGLVKGSEEINLGSPFLLPHVRSKLSHKKVLIVLDDVNDFEQLNVLLLDRDSFGPGSRIIVTTRDVNVFRDIKVGLYRLQHSNKDEALQHFTLASFGGKYASDLNMSCISKFLVLLKVFLMITPSWFHNSAKFFPRFKSYIQSKLVFDNSNSRVDERLDAKVIHRVDSHVNNRDNDGRLRREDVEMVMRKLGFFCSRDSKELLESFSSNELLQLFEESEPSLEEVKEAFDVSDENGDGFIDAKEFQRIPCVPGLKEGLDSENCKKMMRNYDINRDERIDFDEFVKFMETTLFSSISNKVLSSKL